MTPPAPDRPFTILIAALGGEGGGLLTDWIIEACRIDGLLVQTTSIPGVAQRTGATTYYVELMKPVAPDKPEPLFALYPAPGYVDLAVATELIEAGRLIETGFVTPDRTTLIASNHRVFAMDERTAMGDGSFQAPRVTDAANALAARPLLYDFAAAARAEHCALNAVLLGAACGAGTCPLSSQAFEAAIAARGVAVEANLRGFALGRDLVEGRREVPQAETAGNAADGRAGAELDARLTALPAQARDIVAAGIDRLTDYQDVAYAELYLDRLEPVAALDSSSDRRLTRETARYLALWMAYEDVIRVADLKSRKSRFDRVRKETAAKPGEPVRITEFLKPGIDELTTVLPAGLGRRVAAWAERRGLASKLHVPLHIRTDTVVGYTLVRLIARLKGRRRKGLRYLHEQGLIEKWLDGIRSAVERSPELALEWAECGRLIKGYSDTRERANQNFNLLRETILLPALSGAIAPGAATSRLEAAREAALADEDGAALAQLIAGPDTKTETQHGAGADNTAAQAAE